MADDQAPQDSAELASCASCFYFRGTPGRQCKRYPVPQRVMSDHWCGEWRDADDPVIDVIAMKSLGSS